MHANVLLKNDSVGELFLANWTRVLHLNGWILSMNANVSLQVTFGSEGPATHFTLEGPFPGVDTVVHLQCTLAAEDTVTQDALIGVCDLFVDVLHQLLKL